MVSIDLFTLVHHNPWGILRYHGCAEYALWTWSSYGGQLARRDGAGI